MPGIQINIYFSKKDTENNIKHVTISKNHKYLDRKKAYKSNKLHLRKSFSFSNIVFLRRRWCKIYRLISDTNVLARERNINI